MKPFIMGPQIDNIVSDIATHQMPPVLLAAATAMMMSSVRVEGKWSVVSVSTPSFPADATMRMPRSPMCLTAACKTAGDFKRVSPTLLLEGEYKGRPKGSVNGVTHYDDSPWPLVLESLMQMRKLSFYGLGSGWCCKCSSC